MKRNYNAPDFEVVTFEKTVLMDQPFVDSIGETKDFPDNDFPDKQ